MSVELDHSHAPIVIRHDIWLRGGWRDRPAALSAVDRVRADVAAGALSALEPNEVIITEGDWSGVIQLVHAPRDVGAGVRAVAALVAKHGLEMRFSLFETPVPDVDPLRVYRSLEKFSGDHQVILWQPGVSVAETVRVVRNLTGSNSARGDGAGGSRADRSAARRFELDAVRARDALRAAGADAEALGPEHFRRKR